MAHLMMFTLAVLVICGLLTFASVITNPNRKRANSYAYSKGTNTGKMRRVNFSINEPDAFVFDELYVVDFTDSKIRISLFDGRELSNKEIEHPQIWRCPKIEIDTFGTRELIPLLQQSRFSFSMEAKTIGTVKHNDNYSVCADGAYWRRIRHLEIEGRLNDEYLKLSISITAGPVETLVKSAPPGPLSESDKKLFVFSRDFIVPTGDIQDFLNITTERNHAGLNLDNAKTTVPIV